MANALSVKSALSSAEHLFLEKIRIDADYIEHINRNVSLEPTVEVAPDRHMVGVVTRFYSVDSERNNLGAKLPSLWAEFVPRLSEIENAVQGVCYGVVRQTEPDSELLEYAAAMEVRDRPDTERLPCEMHYVQIPSAMYASFTHHGDTKQIDQTVNFIYSTWLGSSGMRHTYGPDIEIYGAEYAPGSPDSQMGYSIPVVLP